MKIGWVLACLLSLAASAVGAQDDPAGRVKSAIEHDWVAAVDPDTSLVVVTSPNYAMPFGQGCIFHRLYFIDDGGQPSLARMVPESRYFVFAAGDACARVDPSRFFSIEPGNPVDALLDFGRRLKAGPQPGRDRDVGDAFARISQCFTPEAMDTTRADATRIMRAHSWRDARSGRERYQVTLACSAVKEQGDVIAIGTRGREAVVWQVATLGTIVTDEATGGK